MVEAFFFRTSVKWPSFYFSLKKLSPFFRKTLLKVKLINRFQTCIHLKAVRSLASRCKLCTCGDLTKESSNINLRRKRGFGHLRH